METKKYITFQEAKALSEYAEGNFVFIDEYNTGVTDSHGLLETFYIFKFKKEDNVLWAFSMKSDSESYFFGKEEYEGWVDHKDKSIEIFQVAAKEITKVIYEKI